MTLRLQNLMLAMLLALTTLFVGFGTLSQNPASGGYQLFERAASGISADIQLAALENFAPPPETASESSIAPNNAGANNVNNGIFLNRQLAAQEIAGGHGFEKHVLQQGEFAGLGIRTRDQYAAHIENVLNNPSSVRYTSDGRSFHLQESTGTVVVRNPNAPDGGTAFQPQNWNEYVSGLPTRTEPY